MTTVSLCLSVGSTIYMKQLSTNGAALSSHILHSPFLWVSCICWG